MFELLDFIFTYRLIFRRRQRRAYITEQEYTDLSDAAAAVPAFHLCGRIGCFMAGCCYGIETDHPWAVRYTNFIDGCAVTALRIPVQLMEAGGELVMAALLIVLFCRKQMVGRLMYVYLLGYPVMRFVLEYYRGDWDREIGYGLSMSQIVSVVLFLVAFRRAFVPDFAKKGFRLWQK